MRHERKQTHETHGACQQAEEAIAEPGFVNGCIYHPGVFPAGQLVFE
jgi:hypothetical protein